MRKQNEKAGTWDSYWRERQSSLRHPQGKRRAVTAAFRLAKKMVTASGRPVRVIELGCGEGHILGELLKMCEAGGVPVGEGVGVDYQPGAILAARRLYPRLKFSVADYTSQPLDLEPFDLVLLIGTLHEVYSSNYSPSLGEINRALGRQAVGDALRRSVSLVRGGGYVVLFDGIEHPLRPDLRITIKFKSDAALSEFEKFAAEYKACRVEYEGTGLRGRLDISVHSFTRYITKTRFINSSLWEIEKWESYQYFGEDDFKKSLEALGVRVMKSQCGSPGLPGWRERVRIETDGVDFPKENVLVVGRSTGSPRGGVA